jgi:hypothetical protein
MTLLDLQGLAAPDGGHGGGHDGSHCDNSGLSLLVCGGCNSGLSLLVC